MGTASLFSTDTKTDHYVLLVVPFVAILFDIHTTASSIALREISQFLSERSECEQDWANFRGNRQALLNWIAAMISTILVTIVSAFLFMSQVWSKESLVLRLCYIFVYCFALAITIALRLYERKKTNEIQPQVDQGQGAKEQP